MINPVYVVCSISIGISLILLISAIVEYRKAKKILKNVQNKPQLFINSVQTPELSKVYLDAVESGDSGVVARVTEEMHIRCHHSEHCTKDKNICPICRRYEH